MQKNTHNGQIGHLYCNLHSMEIITVIPSWALPHIPMPQLLYLPTKVLVSKV